MGAAKKGSPMDVKTHGPAELPGSLSWTPGMVDRFFHAYLEAALWSSSDQSDESGGRPMDENYSPEDIPQDVRDGLKAECVEFITANQADLEYWLDEWPQEGPERAGHDFWLTRNGHGAGFWDRMAPGTEAHRAGKRLTEASEEYGTIDL